jgi:hypothetical protein
MIRVKLNGQLVAEMPRHADRANSGPIGFQLHDMNSVLMARTSGSRGIRQNSRSGVAA